MTCLFFRLSVFFLNIRFILVFFSLVVSLLAIELLHTQKMLLDLPSSASAIDFADNTNNNFKVRLPQKLVLETGQWEVGAMVAHILNKFYNIVAGEVTLLSRTSRAKQTHRVTPRFYRTPDSLLTEIRKTKQQWRFDSRSVSSLISMRYNKTTNKV